LAAILGVLAVLVVFFGPSMRVYFRQQSQIAEAKAQLQANQQTVNDLTDQLDRWNDSAYVQQQARELLGWVMPGEIGFHVIGTDGQLLGGGATITSRSSLPEGEAPQMWWDRLVGSILTADDPVPATDTTPQTPATIKPPR